MQIVKIAIFASGNGSNAENIIRYFRARPDEGIEVALVVCNRPGAMVISRAPALGPSFITDRYAGRILNIHPSLLPRFGGKGMYGRHVHEAVVASGASETGITVHHVTERYDEGAIVFQTSIPVTPDDTPDTIEARIHELERLHFPRVIAETLRRSPDNQ